MFTVPNSDDDYLYALTEAQARVWKHMRALQDANGGRPATQVEISRALGMKSRQGCAAHFETLAKLGFITTVGDRGKWRVWLAVIPDPNRPPVEYIQQRPLPSALVRTFESELASGGAKPLNPKGLRPGALNTLYNRDLTGDQIEAGGPTEEEGYTVRQIETWRVAIAFQRKHGGRPATQREISTLLGIASTQGARGHFIALARGGYFVNTYRKWLAVVPSHRLESLKAAPTSEPSEPSAETPVEIPDFTTPQ
jgi:SOS-response transcriptional repressor LexA